MKVIISIIRSFALDAPKKDIAELKGRAIPMRTRGKNFRILFRFMARVVAPQSIRSPVTKVIIMYT